MLLSRRGSFGQAPCWTHPDLELMEPYKRGTYLVFLLFIPLGGLLFGCFNRPSEEIKQAQAAYDLQNFDRALALSESLLEKAPDALDAHRLKILSLFALGEAREAMEDYNLFEEGHPKAALKMLDEIGLGIIKKSLTHENGFVRSAAVKALGEMGNPVQISLIVPGLRDPETFVRFFSAEALGTLGGDEALKLLLALQSDPESMVRVAAVKSLDMLEIPTVKSTTMGKFISPFLNDSDPTVGLFALAAQARRGEPAATPEILHKMASLDGHTFPAAIVALGRTQRPEALSPLIKLLKHPDATLRTYAAEALGELALKEAYLPLTSGLRDQDASVRASTATSLGKVHDSRSIPLLIQALSETDLKVRISAAEGLRRLGQSHLEPYEAALRETDYAIRHFAIGSIRKAWGSEAIPLLAGALNDSAPRVRIAVVRAIGEIGEVKEIALLKQALQDSDLAVRTYAAGNIGRILMKASGKSLKKRGTDS